MNEMRCSIITFLLHFALEIRAIGLQSSSHDLRVHSRTIFHLFCSVDVRPWKSTRDYFFTILSNLIYSAGEWYNELPSWELRKGSRIRMCQFSCFASQRAQCWRYIFCSSLQGEKGEKTLHNNNVCFLCVGWCTWLEWRFIVLFVNL